MMEVVLTAYITLTGMSAVIHYPAMDECVAALEMLIEKDLIVYGECDLHYRPGTA